MPISLSGALGLLCVAPSCAPGAVAAASPRKWGWAACQHAVVPGSMPAALVAALASGSTIRHRFRRAEQRRARRVRPGPLRRERSSAPQSEVCHSILSNARERTRSELLYLAQTAAHVTVFHLRALILDHLRALILDLCLLLTHALSAVVQLVCVLALRARRRSRDVSSLLFEVCTRLSGGSEV